MNRDINWKKISIVGAVLFVVIFISLLVFAFISAKKEREEKLHQSSEELDQLQEIAVQSEKDYAKIFQFIISHVPYPEDEELTILVPMLLSVQSHNEKHHEEQHEEHLGEGNEKIDLISALGSQFVSAVKNSDVEQFLGVFEVYAYMEYINKFNTPEEKDRAITDLMTTISRDGLLVSAGILASEEKDTIELVLQYSDGKEIDLNLQYLTFEDNHYTNGEKNYSISTTFEELNQYFK